MFNIWKKATITPAADVLKYLYLNILDEHC